MAGSGVAVGFSGGLIVEQFEDFWGLKGRNSSLSFDSIVSKQINNLLDHGYCRPECKAYMISCLIFKFRH